MYQYFYLTTLIALILTGIISVTFAVIGKLITKIWRQIMYCLMALAVVSFIGFVVALI